MPQALPMRELVAKYRTSAPRYTSYPTALQLREMTEREYRAQLCDASRRADDPWSLYVHVPFCERRCTFCACAVVATPARSRVSTPYTNSVLAEAELVSSQLGGRRGLAQLHLGGGTPTYLEPETLRALARGVLSRFEAREDMEFSIEVDPRVTTDAHLDVLAELGVNRVSAGVQDLDPTVQSLIGRVQPRAMTQELVEGCRARGLGEINIDLVYGLPGQTTQTLLRTVESVIELAPDRLALYGYAHVPWMRGNQKTIDATRLPDSDARLEMFLAARDAFEDAGYVAIGLDHFAKPGDSLARADRDGTLHRNFMGYTVQAGADLLGLGVTSIGDVNGTLVQNELKLSRYGQAVRAGRLPVRRGFVRSSGDRLRERVISDLMCRHRVVKAEIEQAFGIDFDVDFRDELDELEPLQDDGLVQLSHDRVSVTPRGRPFVRNAAMVFDAYLGARTRSRHSSTI